MEQNGKTCCVLGVQPKDFPWKYTTDPADGYAFEYQKALEEEIQKLIEQGYDYFISDGDIGVNIDFAEAVLFWRDFQYPHIKLEIVASYENRDKVWSEKERLRYREIIGLADKVTVLSETEINIDISKLYIVDRADLVYVFLNEKQRNGDIERYIYAIYKNKKTIKFFLCRFITWIKESDKELQKMIRYKKRLGIYQKN